jgi:hypothetical protein
MLHAYLVALSVALIVAMELFLNRSVKSLSSCSLERPSKLAFHKGCKIEAFNGSVFYEKSGFNGSRFYSS